MPKKIMKVNVKEFQRKLAEEVIGPDSLIEAEVNAEESVYLKVPVNLEADDPLIQMTSDAQERMQEAIQDDDQSALVDAQRDLALAILSFDPNGRPADDALGIWIDAENSVGDLITLWQSMTATVQDALGKFRYKG